MSKNAKSSAKGQHTGNGHKVNGSSDVTAHLTAPIPITDTDSPEHANGNGHSNGNGHVKTIRPVKARVSNGRLLLESHVGNGNGAANGSRDTAPNSVLDAPVVKARVSSHDTQTIDTAGSTTSRLRDSDLAELRLRLKAEEWPLASSGGRRKAHRRELPYFMMRHRSMRATSRVGHTRQRMAARKHGQSGPVAWIARLVIVMFIFSFLATAAGFGAGIGGAAYYVSKLPPVDPSHLAEAINTNGISSQTTKIYDRNGNLLYDFVDEATGRREELPLSKISPLVISATIAAEDANFYNNPGVDLFAILRAVRINLSGEGSSGASTITQQLARNIFMSREERQSTSPDRKIKEAVLAIQLTQNYSKDDIMSLYLNQTFYGHRAYGIAGAALTYFGKPADELTLPEAALLAGLPQAPTEYDPFVNRDAAIRRQAYVLDQMEKQGMITPEQTIAAKNETVAIRFTEYSVDLKAPHFVYYVKQYLEQKYGADVSEAGLKVYTTLDLDVQSAAEKVARDRIDQLKKEKATNAAIVIMKPHTGEILAMVGSVDYNNTAIDGQVNVAIAERQPGSSFKPITYATAFKKGWTPGTVVLDTLTGFSNPGQKDYVPKNYDGRDHGWVTVRESLGNSLNIPAVKALQFAGVQNTIDTAHDMGIKGLNRGTDWYGLSLTLGGGEVTLLDMTNAYSTFANGGVEVDASPIMKIEDAQNRTIYQLDSDPIGTQALDPRISYMITSILSDNKARSAAFGANNPLKLSFPAAAKTGTTDDNRDSWTMGYTPDLTVGVWVGNSNNDEMLKVTGAIGAAVIWNKMMETFYASPQFVELLRGPDGKTHKEFVQPDGLIKTWACSAKGDINDLFLKEAPPKGCTTYKDTNKQLHSAPSTKPDNQPRQKPTPMPGIVFPTPIP
ncbi:MAG: PBP1A family penicillin-binding protein [Chloroflexota bacterium]